MSAHLTIKHLGLSSLALAPLTLTAILSFAVEPQHEQKPKVVKKFSMPPRPVAPAKHHANPAAAKATRSPQPVQVARPLPFKDPGPQHVSTAKLQHRKKFVASSRIRHARSAKRADSDAVREACTLWMKLVPAIPPTKTQFASNAFALSLDPQRYPLIPAEDGGAILVDSKGSLPAPVKSLIQSKNRKIRVVSESPENRRRFYGCLLNAAGFHSVREDSVIEFGNAATITVQADFQVEKNQDSLLHQDVILLNVGQSRSRTPAALVKFLAENGFRVLESGTAANDRKAGAGHLLYQVTGNDPRALSDALLTALGVSFEKGKTIDIYQGEGLGLSLEVTADRYFELQGKRYVVALFDNDPGSDTVAGLLKNRGYRVILLKEGDELHDVAEKMSRQMELKTGYQEYDLWSLREVGYGVRMPGVMLRDRRHGDRKIFVTDRQLDPLLQDLAEVNGYRVVKK